MAVSRQGLAAVAAVVGILGVGAATATSEPAAFVPPLDGPAAVVWAVGDGANGSAQSRALGERIARDEPDRFLYLGDVYDAGTRDEFDDHYDAAYGALADVTAPTPGNHEWGNRGQGYDWYWNKERNTPPPKWYASRVAGWQLLSLNSEQETERGSAQHGWLRRRLAESRYGTCRIAFFHRPRYSTGSHGNQIDLSTIWQEIEGRAAIVLNGHDHTFQRHHPVRGTTAFIVGSGGQGHYSVTLDHPRVAFADNEHYGALRLVLGRTGASWRFVALDGRVLDAGRLSCRRPASR